MSQKKIGMNTYDIEISSNNTEIHYDEPVELVAKANMIKSF
jgi:hypothetical protein